MIIPEKTNKIEKPVVVLILLFNFNILLDKNEKYY